MFSQHVRSNAVAYLALFLALTGTAAAVSGKVRSKDIAKNAVTAPKIKKGAVTSPKLAAGAVTAPSVAAGAVGTGQIADGAVTGAKLDPASLGLGPSAFGPMPAVRATGVLTQTAPAISSTPIQWDPNETFFNKGGFGIGAGGVTVPIDGIYWTRLLVPWGADADAAEREFVAQLLADGDLVQTGAARSAQSAGFNYGPSVEAEGLVKLSAGDQLTGEVYYSGTTPTGGIQLAGLGLTTLEAFWIGPG